MCFKSNNKLSDQIQEWVSAPKGYIVQSFPKIRSKKTKFIESKVGQLSEERKNIKLNLAAIYSAEKEKHTGEVYDKVSKATEQEFTKRKKETLGHIYRDDSVFKKRDFEKQRTT